jgi:predicted HAD superfamily Cof-like phosphohydrolase
MPDIRITTSPISEPPKPVDLWAATQLVLTARHDTLEGLTARELLIQVAADAIAEIGLLRDTVKARSEDLAALRASSSRSAAAMVAEFHEAFDLPRAPVPQLPDTPLAHLRTRLLFEEVREVEEAAEHRDLPAVAHELADVAYVVYGTALTYGIDLDAVLAEVHRANMSKLDADGRPVRRADGKVLKSSLYQAPDVAGVLERQATPADFDPLAPHRVRIYGHKPWHSPEFWPSHHADCDALPYGESCWFDALVELARDALRDGFADWPDTGLYVATAPAEGESAIRFTTIEEED